MKTPVLLPTNVRDETFAGITYHVEGELVPVLTIEITPKNCGVYFENHVLLWKNVSIRIGLKAMKGVLKRMIAGIQIFMTEAAGEGKIAFSRDGAGHIIGMHLSKGESLQVREHQFLAASKGVEYDFEMVSNVSNMLFGGSGLFVDRFHARNEDGILWLHGYGNVFEVDLAAGESIDVEPGGWLYKTGSVKMETKLQRLSVGLLAGVNIVMNRFTGPGRVGIQSMYLNLEPKKTN